MNFFDIFLVMAALGMVNGCVFQLVPLRLVPLRVAPKGWSFNARLPEFSQEVQPVLEERVHR